MISKKIFFNIIVTLTMVCIVNICVASGVLAEEIVNYHTDITINKDASIDVVENIDYDFGDLKKHGIYREIPLSYKTGQGNKRTIKISKIKVLIDNSSGGYKIIKHGGKVKIRIGEKSKLVTGKHRYTISYKISGAINYFDDYDELYWNVIGNEWEIPIKKSSAKITAPKLIKQKCFQGFQGSTEECSIKNATSNSVNFLFHSLEPREMATIVVGLEKGIMKEPSYWDRVVKFLLDNWILFSPLGFFYWGFKRWWQHGRDPRGRGTIIPYYDVPDNLSVAEVSAILYNQLRQQDISAMIIQLAVGGYLKIKQDKVGKIFKHTQYIFLRTKKDSSGLGAEEKFLLDELFAFGDGLQVTTDDLKNKFYQKVDKLQNMLMKKMKDDGYLAKGDKGFNGGKLIVVAILQAVFFSLSFFFFGSVAFYVAGINLAILVFFAVFMGHRTKKGVMTKEKLLGFKLYLGTAEKNRIKFHNAPEKKPEVFEKFLPYAMVFGVEKEWAEQFKDIYQGQQDWYQSDTGQSLNSIALVNGLDSFSKTASASAFSSPSSASSGGSGFSGGGAGGGFGGGGGGSW